MNAPDPVEPATGLRLLRTAFPHWAFLYNPFAFQYLAVRSRHGVLTADSPEQLASRIHDRFPANATLRTRT